uniref:(northern house mosquito) hypothetical protein n=1 Tax=Culex pipiens TaxID=7175 RepID=A0A8D8FV57_CULPI
MFNPWPCGSIELTRAGAELLFTLFDGLGFELTELDEFPSEFEMRPIDPVTGLRVGCSELVATTGGGGTGSGTLPDATEPLMELASSRVIDSSALVGSVGADSELRSIAAIEPGGNFTVNSVEELSAGGSRNPSFMLNCSDELLDSLRVFFFRRGGAIGPEQVRLSVVFECASLVLAITSGSCNGTFMFLRYSPSLPPVDVVIDDGPFPASPPESYLVDDVAAATLSKPACGTLPLLDATEEFPLSWVSREDEAGTATSDCGAEEVDPARYSESLPTLNAPASTLTLPARIRPTRPSEVMLWMLSASPSITRKGCVVRDVDDVYTPSTELFCESGVSVLPGFSSSSFCMH